MKIIRNISLAAIAAALTASASAFPYSVSQRNNPASGSASGTSIAVQTNGRGVGQKASSNKTSEYSTYGGVDGHRGVAVKSH